MPDGILLILEPDRLGNDRDRTAGVAQDGLSSADASGYAQGWEGCRSARRPGGWRARGQVEVLCKSFRRS